MIEKIIQDELEKFYPEMIELRRYMHMHPEVSFNEKNTARFIKEYLENFYHDLLYKKSLEFFL